MLCVHPSTACRSNISLMLKTTITMLMFFSNTLRLPNSERQEQEKRYKKMNPNPKPSVVCGVQSAYLLLPMMSNTLAHGTVLTMKYEQREPNFSVL